MPRGHRFETRTHTVLDPSSLLNMYAVSFLNHCPKISERASTFSAKISWRFNYSVQQNLCLEARRDLELLKSNRRVPCPVFESAGARRTAYYVPRFVVQAQRWALTLVENYSINLRLQASCRPDQTSPSESSSMGSTRLSFFPGSTRAR